MLRLTYHDHRVRLYQWIWDILVFKKNLLIPSLFSYVTYQSATAEMYSKKKKTEKHQGLMGIVDEAETM